MLTRQGLPQPETRADSGADVEHRIPAAPPMPAPRTWSAGVVAAPSPEKPVLWSPPPLPSISDVVNLKLRPVTGSPQRQLPGGAGAAGRDADSGGGSLLKELASLQLRSRSDGAGHRLQVCLTNLTTGPWERAVPSFTSVRLNTVLLLDTLLDALCR